MDITFLVCLPTTLGTNREKKFQVTKTSIFMPRIYLVYYNARLNKESTFYYGGTFVLFSFSIETDRTKVTVLQYYVYVYV